MTGFNWVKSTSPVNAKYFLNTGGADVSNFSSCDGATVFSIVCHMDVALHLTMKQGSLIFRKDGFARWFCPILTGMSNSAMLLAKVIRYL